MQHPQHMSESEKRELRTIGESLLKAREKLVASHQDEIAQWTRRLAEMPAQYTLGREQAQRIIKSAQDEIDELEEEITNIRAKLAELEA